MNISIESNRLLIRNFIDSDWPYVYDYTKNEKTMQFIQSGALSLSESMRFVHESIGGKPTAFAIILLESNQLIGHLTFTPYSSAHTYEIGWIIHPDYQGHDYASEAALQLVIYAFRYMKIHRIISRCATTNISSWKVMEKIGLRREAHFVMSLPFGEKEWLDEFVYATLRSEWLEKLTYPFIATFKK